MMLTEMLMRPAAEACAWSAADFADDTDYVLALSPTHVAEVDDALASVLSRRIPLEEVQEQDFPLATLGPTLREVQSELEIGRGFAVIRNVPVGRYSLDELELLYAGLLSHLGVLITQDTKGTFVEHVADRGMSYESIQVRGYMTRAELTPHCDSGDVVALLCLRPAKSGGTSQISSSISIYNEILRTRPEYLEPLYRGFHHNIRGNGPAGEWENVTRHRVPVFSYHQGRLSGRYNLKAIQTAEQLPGVEPLSEFEQEAVAYVGELALRDDLRLDMDLRAGDLQLLNNHTVLHTRTAFEDDEDPEKGRLLLRAWINMPNSRPLDPEFADHFNTGPRQPPAIKT
jgi:hypothetical protein